jgi:hypothetical protein
MNIGEYEEKELDSRVHAPIVHAPFFQRPAPTRQGERRNLRKADCSFSALFPFLSGKVLTEKWPIVLVESFPL